MNANFRIAAAPLRKLCRRRCSIVLIAVCGSVVMAHADGPSSDAGTSNERAAVAPAPEWDAIFRPFEPPAQAGPISKWAGGDVAGTVDLDDGRILWVFGDTFLGGFDRHRWIARQRMISNSIAIQNLSATRVPDQSQLHFSWQVAADGTSGAWLAPPSATVGAAATDSTEPGQSADLGEAVVASQPVDGWYWFTGGGAQMADSQNRPRLVLFLFHLNKKQDAGGVWAFKSVGGTLLSVDNPQDDPARWHRRQSSIPFAWGAGAARTDPQLVETAWGVAAIWQRAAADAEAGTLLVYGVRTRSSLDKQLLLARVPGHSVERFDRWRFYAGPESWSSDPRDAVPIAENVTSELSVEPVEFAGRRRFIMVHSQPPLERKILMRIATQPQGPWTEPRSVFSAPDVDRDKSYFAYAAKGHVGLSQPGELLITYVVNSHDFQTAQRDTQIYRPRFIRLPLEAVISPDADPTQPGH